MSRLPTQLRGEAVLGWLAAGAAMLPCGVALFRKGNTHAPFLGILGMNEGIPGDSSRDLLIPDRWRSPTTFERVTFSPSQKGHKELSG